MTSVYSCPAMLGLPVETLVFESIKANVHGEQGGMFAIQRLSTDAIGTFGITLTNVVIGSRVHVEKQSDGTSFYDDIAATSTIGIRLSAYGSGSPYNDLVIKVRKGSGSPSYKPWDTQVTAIVGSQSIYVSQIPDE